MGEVFGLNIYLGYVDTPQDFLLKSLHAQRRSFLLLNLQFEKDFPTKTLRMEEFQNNFF